MPWVPTRPVARNPNTTPPPSPGILSDEELAEERTREPGRITDAATRFWAQLLNLRYRALLVQISHSLHVRRSSSVPRDMLIDWSFSDMMFIGLLMDRLAELPLKANVPAQQASAGAPFELPYTLALSDRERDRWRLHTQLNQATRDVITALKRQPDFTDPTGVLEFILSDLDLRTDVILNEIGVNRPCDGNGEIPFKHWNGLNFFARSILA
jgi:hypothetical protein